MEMVINDGHTAFSWIMVDRGSKLSFVSHFAKVLCSKIKRGAGGSGFNMSGFCLWRVLVSIAMKIFDSLCLS